MKAPVRRTVALGVTTLATVAVAGLTIEPAHAAVEHPVTQGRLTIGGTGPVAGVGAETITWQDASTFRLTTSVDAQHVTVLVTARSPHGYNRYLRLAAPGGPADLAVGTYPIASTPSATHAGLRVDVGGSDLGCRSLTGQLQVHAVDVAADHTVRALDATFFSRCTETAYQTNVAFGRIQVNVTPGGTAVLNEGSLVHSSVPADGLASSVNSGPGTLFGVAEANGNMVTIGAKSDTAARVLQLAAPNGQPLTAGTTYPGAVSAQDPTRPQLRLRDGAAGCVEQTGSFTVAGLAVNASGRVDRLDATFSITCHDSTPATVTTGRILIGANVLRYEPVDLRWGTTLNPTLTRPVPSRVPVPQTLTVGGIYWCNVTRTMTISGWVERHPADGRRMPYSVEVTCNAGGNDFTPWTAQVQGTGLAEGHYTIMAKVSLPDPEWNVVESRESPVTVPVTYVPVRPPTPRW